ncbi:MarR family transcriptional regulator [Nocardioides sp. YIM 152588]|uniref:MarR family winged helix-turn-helix transcriptional regulator n=1 Tax=Nocardioides sp. YIM 152588 TaxID=3158259 RepID=UPI0032E387CB
MNDLRAGEGGTPSLAVHVRQVEAVLRDALQPLLDEHGLTLEHWRILAVVDAEPGLGMSEVATLAVVPAASLTRHMDRLVERALVVRRIDPEDRRRAVVALSPLGREYAARLLTAERGAGLPAPAVPSG